MQALSDKIIIEKDNLAKLEKKLEYEENSNSENQKTQDKLDLLRHNLKCVLSDIKTSQYIINLNIININTDHIITLQNENKVGYDSIV